MVAVIMREGARSLERDYIDVGKFYKISKKKFFMKILLPQLYPYVLSSARSGLSLIWKIVLVVELLGRSDGVGFKLYGFFQFFDIAGILAYTLVFVLLIIFVEFLIVRPFEKEFQFGNSMSFKINIKNKSFINKHDKKKLRYLRISKNKNSQMNLFALLVLQVVEKQH